MLAYYTKGCDEPVILLTDMVAETFDLALRIRNRFARGWDCEGSSQEKKVDNHRSNIVILIYI